MRLCLHVTLTAIATVLGSATAKTLHDSAIVADSEGTKIANGWGYATQDVAPRLTSSERAKRGSQNDRDRTIIVFGLEASGTRYVSRGIAMAADPHAAFWDAWTSWRCPGTVSTAHARKVYARGFESKERRERERNRDQLRLFCDTLLTLVFLSPSLCLFATPSKETET